MLVLLLCMSSRLHQKFPAPVMLFTNSPSRHISTLQETRSHAWRSSATCLPSTTSSCLRWTAAAITVLLKPFPECLFHWPRFNQLDLLNGRFVCWRTGLLVYRHPMGTDIPAQCIGCSTSDVSGLISLMKTGYSLFALRREVDEVCGRDRTVISESGTTRSADMKAPSNSAMQCFICNRLLSFATNRGEVVVSRWFRCQ